MPDPACINFPCNAAMSPVGGASDVVFNCERFPCHVGMRPCDATIPCEGTSCWDKYGCCYNSDMAPISEKWGIRMAVFEVEDLDQSGSTWPETLNDFNGTYFVQNSYEDESDLHDNCRYYQRHANDNVAPFCDQAPFGTLQSTFDFWVEKGQPSVNQPTANTYALVFNRQRTIVRQCLLDPNFCEYSHLTARYFWFLNADFANNPETAFFCNGSPMANTSSLVTATISDPALPHDPTKCPRETHVVEDAGKCTARIFLEPFPFAAEPEPGQPRVVANCPPIPKCPNFPCNIQILPIQA